MRDKEELFSTLKEISSRDYIEFEKLIGDFDFTRFVLRFDKIETDDSKPTLFMVRVPQFVAGFPGTFYNTPVRRTALEDYLTRMLGEAIAELASFDEAGLARKRISIAEPEQKILPRTSVIVTEEFVEARLYVDFPVKDGLIIGEAARDIFFEDLPEVVSKSMLYCNLEDEEVRNFVNLMEDADQLRQVLPTRGWVSFVAENSMPVRVPGTDLPDNDGGAVIQVSDDLAEEVQVSNSGSVRGVGIPAGVTLIIGDVFSGREELMRGIASGIYNHVPGDGREMMITLPDAVYIATEEYRSVQRVDISAFVQPHGYSSRAFSYSSPLADPVSAQSAATVEALEIGARVLLFDESDSAPDFLTRDSRLEPLNAHGGDVVTPLSAIVRQLTDELGVSVVIGGNSNIAEFIPVADTILKVENFVVRDITAEARELGVAPVSVSGGSSHELNRVVESSRWIVPSSIDPSAGREDEFIESPDPHTLVFGRSIIDLGHVRQLADRYQTRTIGLILNYARMRYMEQGRPIHEVLDLVDRDLSSEGLECLSRDQRGDLTRPRRYEIAAALNRLETLRVTQAEEPHY